MFWSLGEEFKTQRWCVPLWTHQYVCFNVVIPSRLSLNGNGSTIRYGTARNSVKRRVICRKFFGNYTHKFSCEYGKFLRSFCIDEYRIMVKVGYLVCVLVLTICFCRVQKHDVCVCVLCLVDCEWGMLRSIVGVVVVTTLYRRIKKLAYRKLCLVNII